MPDEKVLVRALRCQGLFSHPSSPPQLLLWLLPTPHACLSKCGITATNTTTGQETLH